MTAPVRRARSWAARLLPYAVALFSLPLLGPTCGGQQPGQKAFSKSSLIIPMDGCYQFAADGTGQSATRAGCGTATSDTGDVIKAYGLVYQLVRAGVPVYWVISPTKATATGVDVTVSYAGGPPVVKYVWSDPNGAGGSAPPNNLTSTVSYVGGPFVVDGSDYAAANAVLQSFQASYSSVNVHVAQVAFQGNAAKVFSGGWNAGGAVAPKLALLNIPGGDGRYADHVLEGYLVKSALAPACVLADPPCADNSAGTATGTHGNIYDRLEAADFIPPTCVSSDQCNAIAAGSVCRANGRCDWKSTNVYRGGYKVLWLPHWTGPNSCEGTLGSGYDCGTGFGGCGFAGNPPDTCSCVHNCTANLTSTELSLVLQTIGSFQAAGNDVFGECGGIGTMEGTYDTATANVTASFGPGDASSRFMTSGTGVFPAGGGVWINEDWSGSTPPAVSFATAWFPSPFLQIGDFPFRPQTGLIQSYRPAQLNGSAFRSTVVHLISEPTGNRVDVFSHVPAAGSAGNVVYLAGHDYSGFQGPYQIAGTRLVLNTLFNLSATCQPRLTACSQMKNFGTCRPGVWQCCSQADIDNGYCQVEGEPVCRPTNDTHGTEICNGQDDDCNGIVDDHLTDPQATSPGCYDGPPATVNPATGRPYGTCLQGVWSCQQTGTPQSPSAAWVCVGEVLPGVEACNGLDDDCNGTVDDNVSPPGGTAACFTGPPDAVMQSTFPQSQCKPGTWACQNKTWACNGQQLPQQEICEGLLLDYNCNGLVGDGCECVVGTTRACYTGPAGTPGHGICRTGRQSCVQDPGRPPGQGVWDNPSCSDQVLPNGGGEICGNGLDDDCDGAIDEGCTECTSGQTRSCYPAGVAGCTGSPGGSYTCAGVCAAGSQICVAGKWGGACAGAITPGPELCDGKDNACAGTLDETNATCPASLACLNGVCTQPSWGGESDCLPGYVHDVPGASGNCVPQPCPSSPCPAGQLCQGGTTCVDPCAGKVCGTGAFCSIGVNGQAACIGGGCSAGGCTGTDVCRNGVCQPDVCAGVSCPAGTFCRGNYGLATPTYDCVRLCATVSCAVGQACGPDGFCAPDPCATVTCPTGQVCRASGSSASCGADPCPPGICGAGQACVEGRCTDDPCAGVVCPAGVCARGQCYASNNPNGYGQPPTTPTPAQGSTSGGCGCGGGEAGPTALLLSLLALPVARRRRTSLRGRGALGGVALLLVGLMALGAGCSKKKTTTSTPVGCATTCGTDHCVDVQFDAAHCASCGHACAASEVCVDSICINASPSVPSISSVSPAPVAARTSPTFTIAGDRFQSGAVLRVSGAGLPATEVATSFGSSTQLTASVDLSAALTGTLSLQVANPDHTVSNAFGVAVVTPTPAITGVSPATAVAGSQVQVHVTGSGFTPYAVCVQRAGPAEIVIPPAATPTSAALDCTLDLSAVAPGTIQIVVQNENLVESAPFPFDVASATPSITSLSPNPAQQGSEVRLIVTGSGFVPNSIAQIWRDGTYNDLLTTFAASTLLQAQLSLSAFAAGTYPVRVVNQGGPAPSAPVDLLVTPTAPVATGLVVTAPGGPSAPPRLGDVGVQLAFTGSGFNASCQVEVLPAGGTWLGPPAVVTLAGTTPGAIQGTTDMTGSEGTWYARVTCTAGCSSPPCLTSAFPFQVVTNVASLASATPAGGAQGATVPVTVTGANFSAGMVLRLSGAAADISATLDAATPSSKATASIPLAGLETGGHLLRAVNAGASESNGIGFSVTPGAPSISGTSTSCSAGCSAACAVQQPNPVTITISGSNFGSGISVAFATSSLGRFELTPPLATMTVVDASTIQVVLDTTQVPGPLPATFTVTVENPGQPPSNGVSYKVAASCP